MSVADLETEMACKALAARLRDWGVQEPARKARIFMDELTARGWRSTMQKAPRNPQPHEECPRHEGQYRLSCGGCRADKRDRAGQQEDELARRRDAGKAESLATIRATLSQLDVCSHGVKPNLCADHTPDHTPARQTPAPTPGDDREDM